jgi:cation transport ATPase
LPRQPAPQFFTATAIFARAIPCSPLPALLLRLHVFTAGAAGASGSTGAAIVGGLPLFLFAAKGLFLRGDITAGVMASTATIAAIVVGEYAAAALVVFMMSVGEWLENFTVARADSALRDLSKLVPAQVMVVRWAGANHPLERLYWATPYWRTGERWEWMVWSQAAAPLNQAAITGESMPVIRSLATRCAGTLNAGLLEICVTCQGGDHPGADRAAGERRSVAQAPVQRPTNMPGWCRL